MSKTKFPLVVKRGNVRVKIYSTPSHGHDSFTVAFYHGGRRQRRTFADLALARQEAELVANRSAAGEMDVLALTSADRSAYVRSVELLRESGTPLELAVMQFVEAVKVLEGGSLVEAVRFYAQHHSRKLPTRSVAETVAEMILAKQQDGASAVYVRDLKSRLGRFGQKFACPIAMVLAAEIQDYLRGLAVSGRSKNNTRKAIRTLFSFAQARGYLPKGATEAADLPLTKQVANPIGIFTAEEMAKLLAHGGEMVPFLAIGAFAGLRHAEILRLDWQEVDLAGGHIEVKAAKAKTASRRLVPMSGNLKAWLAPYHQGEGKVVVLQQVSHLLKQVAVASKVKWKLNGLRHSYISYRVAQIQNVAQVALEAGNSPQIIFSNYRELVKPAAAVKWFAIEPEMPANVIAGPTLAAVG
jgi:integrase